VTVVKHTLPSSPKDVVLFFGLLIG